MSDNKKSFLKEYRAIILWFAFAILSFILATALLNKFTYNQFFVKISPFVTIKKLWSILPRVKQKMRVYKPLFSFFGVILVYLAFGFIAIWKKVVYGGMSGKYNTKKNENERETIKGSARWADNEEIKSCGYLFDYTDDGMPPIIFGQSNDAIVDAPNPFNVSTKKKGKYIIGCDVSKKLGKTPTVNHTMIIGVTRCGKGVGTIIPTLLSYKSSLICYDPACENYERTAGYRRKFGSVQYFNPQDVNSTLHFNPLEWIRKDKNYIMTDIGNVSQIIVPENPKANDSFWDNSARNLINIYIAYVLLFYPKEMQTMKEVSNVARIMSEKDIFSLDALRLKRERLENIINGDDSFPNEEKERARKQEEIINKSINEEEEKEEKLEKAKEEARAELKSGGGSPFGRKKVEEGGKEPTDEEVMSYLKRHHPELFKDKEDSSEDEGMLALINKMFKDVDRERAMLLSEEENPDNAWKIVCLNQTWNALNKLKSSAKSENTIASIVSVADSNLQFYADENIAKLMDKSTFTADDLTMKDKALSLYLCILNQDTDRCKSFVKLFVTMVANMLSRDAEEYKKNGKQTVLFLIDEFPQLGKMKSIAMAIPYIGKFGVVFMLITQDLKQLEEAYGKEGAASMINNMQLVNVKKVGLDTETRSMVSKLLGNKTVLLGNIGGSISTGPGSNGSINTGVQTEQRALMTEDEVGGMSNAEQIIIIPGVHPVLCKKLQWFCEPLFQNRESQRNQDIPLEVPVTENPNGLGFFSSIMTLKQDIEKKEDKKEENQNIDNKKEEEPKPNSSSSQSSSSNATTSSTTSNFSSSNASSNTDDKPYKEIIRKEREERERQRQEMEKKIKEEEENRRKIELEQERIERERKEKQEQENRKDINSSAKVESEPNIKNETEPKVEIKKEENTKDLESDDEDKFLSDEEKKNQEIQKVEQFLLNNEFEDFDPIAEGILDELLDAIPDYENQEQEDLSDNDIDEINKLLGEVTEN